MFKRCLSIVIIFFLSSAISAKSQLTIDEVTNLKNLECKPMNFKFYQGKLIWNSQQDRSLFLIKNITSHKVIVDFPAAHIGATAWITQELLPNEWTRYVYIKGKDGLLTQKNGITQRQKPIWECTIEGDTMHSQCNQYLYICQITNLNPNGSELQREANQIIKSSTKSWWGIFKNGDSTNDIKEALSSNFTE